MSLALARRLQAEEQALADRHAAIDAALARRLAAQENSPAPPPVPAAQAAAAAAEKASPAAASRGTNKRPFRDDVASQLREAERERTRRRSARPPPPPLNAMTAAKVVESLRAAGFGGSKDCVNFDLVSAWLRRHAREVATSGLAHAAKIAVVYHGTPGKDVHRKIEETGLKVPGRASGVKHATDSGFFGKGIYAAPTPQMSFAYSRNAPIFMCLALPGRQFMATMAQHNGKGCVRGYDSHYAPGGSELVFFSTDQILPCFLVDQKSVKTARRKLESTIDLIAELTGNKTPRQGPPAPLAIPQRSQSRGTGMMMPGLTFASAPYGGVMAAVAKSFRGKGNKLGGGGRGGGGSRGTGASSSRGGRSSRSRGNSKSSSASASGNSGAGFSRRRRTDARSLQDPRRSGGAAAAAAASATSAAPPPPPPPPPAAAATAGGGGGGGGGFQTAAAAAASVAAQLELEALDELLGPSDPDSPSTTAGEGGGDSDSGDPRNDVLLYELFGESLTQLSLSQESY